MSRSPLCPAWPPASFILASPGFRSSSSCTTRISCASMSKNRAIADTARPDRFMKVMGFARRRSPALATSAANFPSRANDAPSFAASASANQNPALWRVFAYSRPGLPSPTTRRMGTFIYADPWRTRCPAGSLRGCAPVAPCGGFRIAAAAPTATRCRCAKKRPAARRGPLSSPPSAVRLLLLVVLLVGSLVAALLGGGFGICFRGSRRGGSGGFLGGGFLFGFHLRTRHDRGRDHRIRLSARHDGHPRRQLDRRHVHRMADFQCRKVDLD